MPQPSITKICLKIIYLKFHSNFPGANELRTKNMPGLYKTYKTAKDKDHDTGWTFYYNFISLHSELQLQEELNLLPSSL